MRGASCVARVVETGGWYPDARGPLWEESGLSVFGLSSVKADMARAPIHPRDGDKIASLCCAFYRAETQLLQPHESLVSLLLSDTQLLSDSGPSAPTLQQELDVR